MEQDERIVVLGEDVHRLERRHERRDQGSREASTGPTRVLGTPISENAFVGLGGGLALDGRFRPVVEFMYPDFMWVAADQVFNQIGKARHMFGGDEPGAARAAHQGRDGLRLRLAAPHGSGGHLRHEPRAGASSRRRPPPTTSGS